MRILSLSLAALAAVTLVSCSGGGSSPTQTEVNNTSDTTTLAPDFSGTALPGGDMPGLTGNANLGMYSVEIDVDTMQGRAESWRSLSQTDDLYFLSVDNFLKFDSFRIDAVSLDPNVVNVDYTFEHPFAGPSDLNGDITATNRADLGITARLAFLFDLPNGANAADYTFFGGEAIANTDAVTNVDGYMKPNGLLPSIAGLAANTFPYKLVVDEAAGDEGNRVEVGNGGNVEGNYIPETGGWQRGNITQGGVNNNWTGYDYLHQGQSATGRLLIDGNYLQSNNIRFDVAVIAKYQDPRGGETSGEKRANRIPAGRRDS